MVAHPRTHHTPQPPDVIIVHLPTGTNAEEARQGWRDRWVNACTILHEGLQKPSLTRQTLQPAPTTVESHIGTATPGGVWTYTDTPHRGAAEELKTTISSHQGLVHTPHDHMQEGYTLWWQHSAPEGGFQPPADQPGLRPDLTAIAHTVATMSQQVGAPPQRAPSVIQGTAASHNPAFADFRGCPIDPSLPDLDLPTHDAWAVHILVPHDTSLKAGDATARHQTTPQYHAPLRHTNTKRHRHPQHVSRPLLPPGHA